MEIGKLVPFWFEVVLCIHRTKGKDAPPPTGAKGLALMGIGAIRSLVCRSPKGAAQLVDGEGCKSSEKIHFQSPASMCTQQRARKGSKGRCAQLEAVSTWN